MAGLNAGGASPLLGAFLAGLSFCTIRSLEHVWKSQVKRLQTWCGGRRVLVHLSHRIASAHALSSPLRLRLVRIFFACTVGFDVPVRLFGSGVVWRRAAVFYCATLAKLMAVRVLNLSPYDS
jgi:Kef-type K+ transport system membrane component KefB